MDSSHLSLVPLCLRQRTDTAQLTWLAIWPGKHLTVVTGESLEGLEATPGLSGSPSPSSSERAGAEAIRGQKSSTGGCVRWAEGRTAHVVCGQAQLKMVNSESLIPKCMCPEKVPVTILLVDSLLLFHSCLLFAVLKGVCPPPPGRAHILARRPGRDSLQGTKQNGIFNFL